MVGKNFPFYYHCDAAGSALVRWPDIDSCTCLLQPSVAQQRSQYQVTERLHQEKRRRCKTPQNHHTNRLFISSNSFLPPVDEANGRPVLLNATVEAESLPLHVLSTCPSTQGEKDRDKLATGSIGVPF